jgi:Lon protease-like protein
MSPLRQLPMFPLGSPLLPGETLPLQVFEPRYLTMMEDIAASTGEFGVVLISRGWEVGGGDQRHSVGTVATVLHRSELIEGQLAVMALGSHRLRVERWLSEEPYPLAEVEELDGAAEDAAAPTEVTDMLADMGVGMRRVYALASELGADTGSVDLDLPDAPGAAAWRIGSLLPLGAHDRQQLLEADGAGERLELAGRLIDEMVEELTMRLGAGS